MAVTTNVLRRVGILGDIHTETARLQAALAHFAALGVGHVLAVGDLVDGPGNVDETCALLMRHDVIAVAGNHDRWFLHNEMRSLPDAHDPGAIRAESREFLRRLPVTRWFETSRGPLLLCHGLGENDMAQVKPDDFGYAVEANDALERLRRDPAVRFVVNGHTHQIMVRSFGALTIINAGTLLRRRSGFVVADFAAGSVEFYTIGDGEESGLTISLARQAAL